MRWNAVTARLPRRRKPALGKVGERVTHALMADRLEGLGDEGGDQHGLGLGLGNAARAQIEEMVVIDIARGRAMAADDIIGIDLELGLGVELGRLREKQRVTRLLAVGLLGVARDDDLALEDAARTIVHHAFEEFAAGAFRHPMVDRRGAYRHAAGRRADRRRKFGVGLLAGEVIGAVLAVDARARGQREIASAALAPIVTTAWARWMASLDFELELDAVEPRILAQT